MSVTCMLCKSDTFKVDLEKKILTCAGCGCATDISPLMRDPEEDTRQIAVPEAEPQKQLSDDFEIVGGVLTAYKGVDVDVIIPEGVLEIGIRTFMGMTQIRSVQLPESLKVIRREAFYGCTNLRRINIPSSVELVEDSIIRIHYRDDEGTRRLERQRKSRCFWGCVNLTDIVFDEKKHSPCLFEGTAYFENHKPELIEREKALIKEGKCPKCWRKINKFFKYCDHCETNWSRIISKQWGVTRFDLYIDYSLQGDYRE